MRIADRVTEPARRIWRSRLVSCTCPGRQNDAGNTYALKPTGPASLLGEGRERRDANPAPLAQLVRIREPHPAVGHLDESMARAMTSGADDLPGRSER